MAARKTSKSASEDVERAMHERKRGTLKSGGSGKTVTSKKQAIAIGLSEARRAGKKVAKKPASSSRSSSGAAPKRRAKSTATPKRAAKTSATPKRRTKATAKKRTARRSSTHAST